MNYLGADGSWRAISPAMVPSRVAGFDFESEANSFRVRFRGGQEQFGELQLPAGGVVSFGLSGKVLAKPVVDRAEVVYANALPGVDLRYAATPSGVKEAVVLASAGASSLYRFVLQPATGRWSFRSRPDGSVFFQRLDDPSESFVVDAPTVADSRSAEKIDPLSITDPAARAAIPAARLLDPPADGSMAFNIAPGKATLNVTRAGDGFLLDVSIDKQWLADPARVFPVVLDPTLSAGDVQEGFTDTWVGSSAITTSSSSLYAGRHRGLLLFDVTDIPSTATVNGASLNLYWQGCAPDGCPWYPLGNVTLQAAAVTSANWWASSTTDSTVSVGSAISSYTYYAGWQTSPSGPPYSSAYTVTSAVQSWASGSSANYGLSLVANGWNLCQSSPTYGGWCDVVVAGTRSGSNVPYLSVTWTQNGSAPATPTLVSPGASASVPDPQVPLAATSSGATRFLFQVATESTFTTGLIGQFGWLPSGNVTLPASWAFASTQQRLKPGTSYYWRSQARNANGYSAWSSAQSFTLAALANLGSSGAWPMWSLGGLAVNDATGNLVLSAPAPSFATGAGALAFAVSFNHLSTVDRGLGAGWTLSPPGGLKLVDHNRTDGLNIVERVLADGSSVYYQQAGPGGSGASGVVYTAPAGGAGQLTRNPDGAFTLAEQSGSVYSYAPDTGYSSNGIAYLASSESLASDSGKGRLDYTVDASGHPTKITAMDGSSEYGSSSIKGELNLTWGGSCTTALVCVSGPDGQAWTYVGDGSGGTSGRLQFVNNGTRNLVKVEYDGSGRPQYLYTANDLCARSSCTGQNLYASYSTSHRVQVSYESSSPYRVTQVQQQSVTGQSPSTSSTWTFAYTSCTGGSPPSRCTSDATVVAHDDIGSAVTRLATGYTTITPPCQQSGSVCTGRTGSKAVTVLWDERGQLIERINTLGKYMQSRYDASGQLLWTEDEDGNPTDHRYDSVNVTWISTQGPDPDGSGTLTRSTTTSNYDEATIGAVSGSTYTPGSALQGVQAFYFKTANLVSSSSGENGRADAVTNESPSSFSYAWGSSGPGAISGTTNNYSVRFVGDIGVGVSGDLARNFQFLTVADSGTRLIVDGQLLIDNFSATSSSTQTSSTISVGAGRHRFLLEYKEAATGTPASALALQWKCVDQTYCGSYPTTATAIPLSALTPAWTNTTSTVSPSGRVSFSHYDKPWTGRPQYTQVSAPVNGTSSALYTSYTYDSYGRLTGKVMSAGNTSASVNGTTGDITGTGSSSGNYGTSYSYYASTATATTPDTSGLLSGCPTATTLIPQYGLPSQSQQHGLAAVTTIYDKAGRPVSVTNAAGAKLSCYDPEGRLLAVEAAGESSATVYAYDPNGNQVSASHAGSGDSTRGTVTTVYDESNRVIDTTDANGAVAKTIYDEDGVPVLRSARPSATAAQVYKSAVLANGPAAYWRLGEASGTTMADTSGNGNAGIYTGATLGQTGAVAGESSEKAAAVSSTSTYGQSTSTSIGNGAATLTVEAWFKPTASLNGAMRPIVIKPYTTGGASPYFEYVLTITGAAMSATGTAATRLSEFQVSNAVGSRVYLDSTGLYSGLPGAWEYNQWNHIVGTYDGSTMRLYVNGTLVGTTSQTGAVASYATPTRIAGIGNSSAEYFIGNIDEVAIYTSALSACDVQAHYYAATAPSSFTDTTSYGYDDADHRIVQTDPAGRSYCFTYNNRGNLRGTQYPNSTFSWTDTNPAGWTSETYNRHGSISSSTTSPPADASPLADFTYTYNQDGQKTQEQRAGGYSGTVLADSPTAYWRLDETSGSTMADRSGNSNTGTYTGASLGQTGALTGEPTNSAIAVSSTSTYAQTSSTSIGNGASQLSVEAWFKPTASLNGAWRPIVIKPYGGNVSPYYEYQLAVTGSATSATGSSAYRWAEFDITNASGARVYAGNFTLYTGQAGAWEYNQWNHLVGTYDGSTMRVYVNGMLAASASQSGNVASSSNPTQVGGIGLSSVEYFIGTIDEVAIYPSALSCGTTTIGATCTATSQIGKQYAAASAASAGGSVNYSYDTAGRLETASTLTGATFRYCYDPDSNRSKIVSPSSGSCASGTVTSTYAYTAGTYTPVDALTSVTPAGSGATSYAYEGAGSAFGDGHLTTRGADTFGWDTWGRLTTATVGGSTACYTYDPVGALKTRTYKTSATSCSSPSGTTNYLLGDLYETNASGTTLTSYADGPAGDLASFAGAPSTSSTVSFLYYSGHGDLAAEANTSGTATAAHSYDAWGAPGDTPPANQTAHRFTGRWDKQYDATTSLVLMGARPYDPATGRFLAVDPIEGGSLNNYDYAGQDPINGYDLDGNCSTGVCWAGQAWSATVQWADDHRRVIIMGGAIAAAAIVIAVAPYAAPAVISAASTAYVSAVTAPATVVAVRALDRANSAPEKLFGVAGSDAAPSKVAYAVQASAAAFEVGKGLWPKISTKALTALTRSLFAR